MEQTARQRRSRGCAGTEGHQVGVGEEPAGPDPGAAGLVGVAVQDQLGPVPGVPAQGATPAGVLDQGRNRSGTARRVAGLGPTRSQLPGFVALAATIKRFQQLIFNTLDHGLSNALSGATNTHLRALTKRAKGFHTPEAFIAMAMLTRGGLCPA